MASKAKTVKAAKPAKTGGALLKKEEVTTDFLAEMQKDAVGYAANVKVQGDGNYLSTKGGVFAIRGDVLGNEIECVILMLSHVNQYYEGAYDPNVKGVTPSCFALSLDGENMAPTNGVPDKQSDACEGCWASEIGTASVGKGRACKAVARVELVHSQDIDTAEAASEATILTLSVPTMSKNNMTSFIKVLAENPRFKLPPYAVRTKISIAPHPQYQYTLSFTPLEVLDDASVIRVLQSRARGEATEMAMAPFQAIKKADPAKAPKGKGKTAGKAVVVKKKVVSATRGGRSRFG